jgi:hypothetical protein
MTMTGYTQELIDSDLDFTGWAFLCARAMGVCITMRDEPLSTPIPEEFKPSEYHLEAYQKAEATVATLEKMSHAKRISWGNQQKKKQIKILGDLAVKNDNNRILVKMQLILQKTHEWQPPTEDHKKFKDFMVQQLTDSISSSSSGLNYYKEEQQKLSTRTPLEHFNIELDKARRDVSYHKKEWDEEVKRTEERNKWIKSLRDSLPPSTTKARASSGTRKKKTTATN